MFCCNNNSNYKWDYGCNSNQCSYPIPCQRNGLCPCKQKRREPKEYIFCIEGKIYLKEKNNCNNNCNCNTNRIDFFF